MSQTSSRIVAVVDDEAAVCEATASLLRSAGLRVASFTSAEDFLAGASPGDFGCLILDVNLPGMNGLQLQQSLVQNGCGVPVILITARDDGDGRIRAQAMQQGARALLFKPFLDDDLLDAVRSALQG